MSGATDLIGLIDLSLGERPSGVVNFNYLHSLLHEIVRRLGIFEEQQLIITGPLSGLNLQNVDSAGKLIRGSSATIPGLSDTSLHQGVGGGVVLGRGGIESVDTTPSHHPAVATGTVHPATSTTTAGGRGEGEGGIPPQSTSGTTPVHAATQQQSSSTVVSGATQQQSSSTALPTVQSSSGGVGSHVSTDPSATVHGGPTSTGGEQGSRSGHASATDIHGRPSSSFDMHRPTSRVGRHRSSTVSAANDMGFLERKLQELETRLNTMESLPELLERKGSDVNATPVRDMWNFTSLNNRVGSVEKGIDKTSQLVDELLGEVQSLKQQLNGVQDSTEKRLDGIGLKLSESEEKLKQLELEALKPPIITDDSSATDKFIGALGDLQQKVEILRTESSERLKNLEEKISESASASDMALLQDSLKELNNSTDSKLTTLQGKLEASEYTMGEGIKTVSTSVEKLIDQMRNVEAALLEKVSASDLTSLMPTSSGEDASASILPKLIALQTRINQVEEKVNQQPSLPADVVDKIKAMQNAIDHLSTEISKLSGMAGGGASDSRLDELGSQLAQMRERLEETDRAVTALTNAVAEQSLGSHEDSSKSGEFIDAEAFKAFQEIVHGLQEGQERLLGTAANLSHELEVNQEHVKALYSAVDELKAMKVDKDQLALEVEEKADRSALDSKASREWVDSTFERLDREIREAKSHLMGHEEAFKSAVGQLNEDVEGKLDRLELEPLRQYIDKNLQRIKTAPLNLERSEKLTDDAAGFRKPLRFRCISCDKPLGLKATDPIPSIPMSDNLPATRTFRPYTTYELELIRRHQKIQPTVLGPPSFPVSIRSAGGSHTLTRPHQKIRVTPYSGVVPDNTTRSTPSVFVHDEMDIIGQDGHIYKGRVVKHSLPPISKRRQGHGSGRHRATKVVRPSSTTASHLQSVQS